MTVTRSEKTSSERNTLTCSGCDAAWSGVGRAHCAADGCHRTFATASLFDLHRSSIGEHGSCRNPRDITRREDRVMYFRDGLWRSPELTEEQKEVKFKRRAGTTTSPP